MKPTPSFFFLSKNGRAFKSSSFGINWIVRCLLILAFVLLFACDDEDTDTNGDNTPPEQPPQNGFVELRLSPEGGSYALGENGLLNVPAGAVEEATTIRVRLLPAGAFNRLLYKRNMIVKHFTDRTVEGTHYLGSTPWTFAAGVEIQPSGVKFDPPVQVELPSLPGLHPDGPLHVKIDESRDALLLQPGTVAAIPVINPNSPYPDIPPITHHMSFGIKETSKHAVVQRPHGPEWIDCAAIDPNDPAQWSTACRVCGRISVEQGSIDYTVDQCVVKQLTTRVTFHDCPGSPAEEHTQQILSPECGEVEPIEDLLNYRPGKTWLFQFQRTRVTPAWGNEWKCAGDQTVRLSLNGEVTILPEEDIEGNQRMDGSGQLTMSSAVVGCLIPQQYQLEDDTTGAPFSVPVKVSGQLFWGSYIKRPAGSIYLHIQSELVEQADHLTTRDRGWDTDEQMWAPWQDIRLALVYERLINFLKNEFIPYSISRNYNFGDHPWPAVEFMILDLPDSAEFMDPPHRYSDQFFLDVQP